MPDVFISYARATEATAERVAAALRALGYDVWRDDQLAPHRTYADEIEQRLRSARAVVVLWSADAVKSHWVRAEADLARNAGKLVQATLEGATPPLPFNQIQSADLSGWLGEVDAPAWRKIVDSVTALAGAVSGAGTAPGRLSQTRPTLAVLPFDNLSGDPEMTYFSDGVSEEILQTVSRTSDLTVIARSSSFQFRGATKSTRQIASALNATHLLDGSVRRSGQRVRITAQLVDCATETTLWTDRLDRELSDVFALQDEIAAAVAEALKVAFAPSASVERIDPTAYDLYLRARTLSVDQDATAAIELLEQAVAHAPKFAAAWAALCVARATQARWGPRPKPYAQLKAGVEAAARIALELNPRSGLPYAALSRLEAMGEYARREALLRQAQALSPDEPDTLTAMGAFCNHVGFVQEALGYVQRAWELDPLYPEAANVYGAVMAASGRYEEGLALYEGFRARWPEHEVFIVGPLNYAALRGDWPLYDKLVEVAHATGSEDPSLRSTLRIGDALRHGDETVKARLLDRMRDQLEQDGAAPLHALVTASALGLTEECFALIEASSYAFIFEESGAAPAGVYNPGIIFDPTYNAAMMADVRFVGLCAKLGLCRYWANADRWPDCAQALSQHYDFRAEARRLAGAPA